MADEKNINSEQNLMPEKKLNWWQKFVAKFKTFSPSKKGLVLGLIILGVVVLGLIVGFAFARLPFEIIDGPGGPSTPDDNLPLGRQIVYLEPFKGEIEIDKVYDIKLRLKDELNDLVAVGMNIEYNPSMINVQVNEEVESDFPKAGFEEGQTAPGVLKILRGRDGDSNVNNEMKGKDIVVAGLQIEGIGITGEPVELKITQISAVKDDGDGSLEEGFVTQSGEYTVIQTLPSIEAVDIQPFNNQAGNWQANISWQTNIDTESQVSYILKQTGKSCENENLNYSSPIKDDNIRKQHSAVLPQAGEVLEKETNYCLKIEAKNIKTEKTAVKYTEFDIAGGTQDLTIKNLSAEPTYGGRGVTLKWNTVGGEYDGLSNTEIVSCRGGSVEDNLPIRKSEEVLLHQVTLSGLENNTSYTCTVASTDRSRERATKETLPFTTSEEKDADANIILQVRKDRICDEWLYCRSSVQVINKNDEKENLCFDLGVCQEEDEQGNCIDHVGKDDVLGEQVFTDQEDIKNLSGFSKVGFDWGDNKKIDGYYHYANMTPVGTTVHVPNGDFEEESNLLWTKENAQISIVNDPENKVNKILRIIPQQQEKSANLEFLEENLNFNVPTLPTWTNVSLPIGEISNENKNNYVISLGMRTEGGGDKQVDIQLITENDEGVKNFSTLKKQVITPWWQTIVVESEHSNSAFARIRGLKQGYGYLNIGSFVTYDGYEKTFYIDNVKIKPALKVSENKYRSAGCRMYPSNDAKSCDDVSLSGKQTYGWRGYCVEEDPKYSNMCLNWWPVDILPGEADVFGTGQQAGYTGRQPLYYCLEAQGNYNRENLALVGAIPISTSDGIEMSDIKIIEAGQNGYRATFGSFLWWSAFGNEAMPYAFSFATTEGHRLLRKSDIDSILFNDNMFIARLGEEQNNREMFGTSVFEHEEKASYVSSRWKKDSDEKVFIVELSEHQHEEGDLWGAGTCSSNDFGNFIGLRLEFNDQDELTNANFFTCDDNGNSLSAPWLSLTFTLKEPCNVIAKVTGENGENKAWSSRISKNGWQQENELGYTYDLDYYPYGAAVVPEPANNPEEWDQPLYVMPANDSMGQQAPYQARAGYPYSALGNLGRAECISGSAEKIGTQCDSNSECGYSLEGEGYGLCVGVNLSEEQSELLSKSNYQTDGWGDRLSKLFAKVYGVWEWDWDEGGNRYKYKNIYYEFDDQGSNWDVTGDANSNSAPQVKNIKINQSATSTVQLLGTQKVILEFNSYVDADHLPLKGYKVDWDDGTANSQISNLKMMPKVDEKDPHVLFHTYECITPQSDDTCEFVPKIQIQDNWGWCNNGYTCNNNVNTWTSFEGVIRVTNIKQ